MPETNKTLLASEYMLLGLLDQKPAHGYELFKRIDDPEDIGMIWGVKMANLYAQLGKLNQLGLISGIFIAGDARPSRMLFTITPVGISVFEAWLGEVVTRPREFRPNFLLKLYFMRLRTSTKTLRSFCKQQLEECNCWLEESKKDKIVAALENKLNIELLEYRMAIIKAQINWLMWLINNS